MIRDILRQEIEKAVLKLYPEQDKGVFGKKGGFAVKGGEIHADYYSNAAMVLKEGNPRETAEKIKDELLTSENFNKYFCRTEIAGPGFMNFWLSDGGLEEGIKTLNKKFPRRKEKISLDYLDANPTGPIHLGHARAGFFGDVLSNILGFYGYKVSREFYVNNAKSSMQIQSLGKTALGQGEEYKHEQLLSILKKPKVAKKLAKIKKEAGLPAEASAKAGFYIASLIQKENEKFLKTKAKIKFDLFFEEEKVYLKGRVKEIIEKLKKTGAVYEKDGALWFKSTDYGDNEDRVLVRNTGEPTYFVPDVYYHLDRLVNRKNDLAVDIFGADHFGYIPRLKGALQSLGIDSKKIQIVIYQMVRLVKDGQEVKMSKRKGEFVTLEELIDEVGLDSARFFFLMHSVGAHMDFDLDLAKEQSKKNPVYYVQYAHARMCSILAKSKILNSKSQTNSKFLASIRSSRSGQIPNSKYERNLILKLIRFPEIIEDTANDYQVHRLTTYVYELAGVFTDFYENVPVIKAETKELKKARLSLTMITRQTLEKALSLLGISSPEKM